MHTLSVLIVDDNPRLIEDYSTFLKDNHLTVYTASDGPSGIEQAKKHRPAVILLDLMLPGMNGLETLEALKADEATKSIPVIIITALVEDKEKDSSLKAGATAYIAKVDTEPKDLLESIKSVAKQGQS